MKLRLNKISIILTLVFFLGIFLRVYNVGGTLLYNYDQGYHGLAIKEIWDTKKIVMLGHKTDSEGIFHGSLFYYIMLPIYLVSSWDPASVSSILAFIDGVAILIVFMIGRKLFSTNVGILAAIIYAVSYSLISYSRWLSNVTLIPFFSSVYIYTLTLALTKNFKYLLVSAFVLGVVVQFNGAIGFFLFPSILIPIFYLRGKIKSNYRIFLLLPLVFLIPSIPLFLFEIRHNFLVSNAIIKLFTMGSGGIDFSVIGYKLWFLRNEFVSMFSYSIPGISYLIGLAVLTALIVKLRKNGIGSDNLKYLLFSFGFSLMGYFVYPKSIYQFFYVGILPFVTIIVAWGINYWFVNKLLTKAMIILVLASFLVNLYNWQGFLKPGFNLIPFGSRNIITLNDRLKGVDFMYQKAGNVAFRTDSYIIPYFQEQPWKYIYSWYGKSKYGYEPLQSARKSFSIYEPDYDYPYRLTEWLDKMEKEHGPAISRFTSNSLVIEERGK